MAAAAPVGLRAAAVSLLRAQGRAMALVQTMLAQGGLMALNFATGVLTARLLGPDGRGAFAAIGLWLMIPSLLASAGMQTALIFEGGKAPDRRLPATAAALLLTTLLFVPLALACLPLIHWLLRAWPMHVVTAAEAAMLLSVVNVWVVIARSHLLAGRAYGHFNAFVVSFTLLYLLALLALAVLHQLTPTTAIAAQIATTAAMLAAWLPELARGWRGLRLRHVAEMIRPLASYARRAAIADVVSALSSQLDAMVLVALIAPRELGLYVAAFAFAKLLSVIQAALSSILLADLAGRPPPEVTAFLDRSFRLLLWFLVVGCVGLLAVDRLLLTTVYGADFAEAAPVFRFLLVDAALSCLGSLLSQALLALDAPASTSRAQGIAFGVTTVSMLVLAPLFGAMGAAGARAFGSGVRLALLFGALPDAGLAAPGFYLRRSDLLALRRLLPREGTA